MKLSTLSSFDFEKADWGSYDLIILASGFEERSRFVLESIPHGIEDRCLVLGFSNDTEKLSRPENDEAYIGRSLRPFVASKSLEYEETLRGALIRCASIAGGRPIKVLVDYSVMTRAWYGYLLTWLKYSRDSVKADVDFVYVHGKYEGEFDPLHIEEITAISGFEGGCAGARRTVAFFGLGYDRYATLAVHEFIEPDSVICFIARESRDDPRSKYVLEQNREMVEASGRLPVDIPLGNLKDAFRILYEQFAGVADDDEIIAIPMGPKPHVLATMMVTQLLPKITCLHAKGTRQRPVQVTATGEVSSWRAEYR